MAVHYGNSAYFVGRFFGSLFSKWIDGIRRLFRATQQVCEVFFIYQLFYGSLFSRHTETV
jgi:hypothetical protein